ncbi:MAG: hypothetical protein ABIJ18_04895 [archaeon]
MVKKELSFQTNRDEYIRDEVRESLDTFLKNEGEKVYEFKNPYYKDWTAIYHLDGCTIVLANGMYRPSLLPNKPITSLLIIELFASEGYDFESVEDRLQGQLSEDRRLTR